MVIGGPGMGKSALLARWLARREASGTVVPHHFIRRGEYDWDDPARLVGSLVAQIEEVFPDQREPERDARIHAAARLEAMLRRVSENALVPRGDRLVVLIDGLDEYDPPPGLPGRDPLAAFLPRALPRGVSFLCASRPRHPYVDMLATRGALQLDLDDTRAFAADNEATVRAFWNQVAPELGLQAAFIRDAVASARGNLQHAAMLRSQLVALPPEDRRALAIPRGLAALLASAWERIATDPAVVEGLGVLCAARDTLTLDEIGIVAGWTREEQRRAFVRGARELLIEGRRDGGAAEYRLHHDSIRGQIGAAIGDAALRAHHRALAQRLACWPPAEPAARRYALRHALLHRAEAGDWNDAWRLAADLGFLEAKFREIGVAEAEADAMRLAGRCRAGGDEALGRRFDDLARALARESHWLQAAPEAVAPLLWNRLRRSGWSATELDGALRVPNRARFLRVRHVAVRESAALLRELAGHSHSVNACAVTPDGRRMISASTDGTLQVWDLDTGRRVVTLAGHASAATACAVTADGRRAVSASHDRTLKVWDLDTGCALATLEGHTSAIRSCAVAADDRRVISASDDRTLKVWDIASGRVLATLDGHACEVRACAVTASGRVVSASWDRTLKVWDLDSAQALITLEGHADVVVACAVTADGRRVVSVSNDGTLKVWELATGRALMTFERHIPFARAWAVTRDGRRVVSPLPDRTLGVWDLETRQVVATLEPHASRIRLCAVTPDGQRVISATHDGVMKIWGLEQASVADRPSDGHAHAVKLCAMTAEGSRVTSVAWDGTCKVWDPGSGSAVMTMEKRMGWVTAVAVTPDGRRVVSASRDPTLKVWDLESGRIVASMEGHTDEIHACAVTASGQRAISGANDTTLRVWDLDSGRALATLQGHERGIETCVVTMDDRYAVSGSRDGVLKVWDLADSRALATWVGHARGVRACAMTPDGRVVSASWDRTVKLWELDSGRSLATLDAHDDVVNACTVTPDGRYLVLALEDRTLRVWDLETCACVVVHRGDAAYTAVAASAAMIVAGDASGTLWFLDWPPPVPG